MPARSFRVGATDFLLDGEPIRILAGALHYFRVHPDQWRDRIRAARLMGLNTIETYIPWNEHEPRPGEVDLTGRLDLGRFLDLVHDEGMLTIVRPGPYICAEWDAGGLPGWLFRDAGVQVRSSDPRFLHHAERYLRWVFEVVVPRQIDRGGAVVLVQVENEYGAFGDAPLPERARYLDALSSIYRDCGVTVPLTTVDQPTDEMLAAGGRPDLLRTGSFGGRSAERLATLRAHQAHGPLMCAEFWCGWFDHWGSFHRTAAAGDSAGELDTVLSSGASVNIYMFHGGTNFALTNGSNDKGVFEPTVTSYDYDAPLDEAGRPTVKYWRFRAVLSRYVDVPDIEDGMLPGPLPSPPRPVPLLAAGVLDDVLGEDGWHSFRTVPTMDAVECYRGLMVYRTRLSGGSGPSVLTVGEVRDRATVMLDGVPVGTLSRSLGQRSLLLPTGRGTLSLVVEDQGRVNYGARIGEHKGLIGPIRLDGRDLVDWAVQPVDLAAVPRLEPTTSGAVMPGPRVLRADLRLRAPQDLVVDTRGLGKGMMWIGDFCLGRYWEAGPQHSLFVPAPVTRRGVNRITVLELDTAGASQLSFSDRLLLGPVEH